jgi:hypothetical protein
MTLETRRYRRALQLALSVAGRAATFEECRARLSTALNLINKRVSPRPSWRGPIEAWTSPDWAG